MPKGCRYKTFFKEVFRNENKKQGACSDPVRSAVGCCYCYGNLTDTTEEVKNTFTVGQVALTLDEAPVNEYGEVVDGARRVQNAYKLIPGNTYVKDPTVHVTGNSEDSWIFVKVTNGISALEAADNTIASQITAYGWKPVDGTTGVFYQEYTKQEAPKDYVVFENFKIAGNANASATWANAGDVTVTAYAVQKANVATAKEAWDLVKPTV